MTPEKQKLSDLQKENRVLRKDMQSLSDDILIYADWMDTKIGPDKSIPKHISSLIAKGLTALELRNDMIRYGSLGVDYRKDDKAKAIKKLREGKL